MMDFTRAASDGEPPPAPIHTLPTQQRRIVEAIDAYERATGEPCSAHYLGRRFALNPKTIRSHFIALHRKGWLRSEASPARLRRRILDS